MTEAAPYRYAERLDFRPVDLERDEATVISFGRALYLASLDDDRQFHQEYGRDGKKFAFWVAFCGGQDRSFASLLTENDIPIGMVVGGPTTPEVEGTGHLHHLYVMPSHRGQGFGGLLDDFAREAFKSSGFTRARLNVTKKNERAIRFYLAQGWEDIPLSSKKSRLRYMETVL